MNTCNTTVMKKPEANKKGEGTLSGTAKTLIDPEVCTESSEGTLKDPEVCTEDTEEALRDPVVGTEDIKEALMDPEANP